MKEQQTAQLNYLIKKHNEQEKEKPNKMAQTTKEGSFRINHSFFRIKLATFVDSNWTVGFMTLITIYALFFDDIKILFFPKSDDDIFNGITLFGMICFAIEIMITSYAKPDEYPFSFFFYLDIISTISMIPDCGWIWDAIIGDTESETTSATGLAKTSRAGRVTRIIRVLRLIRLIRIVKLYKQKQIADKKREQHHTNKQRRNSKARAIINLNKQLGPA